MLLFVILVTVIWITQVCGGPRKGVATSGAGVDCPLAIALWASGIADEKERVFSAIDLDGRTVDGRTQ
jgi:hypothetical protein